ncbi:MAG: lipid A deacylase LpxR family protein [Desulfobulbaceae bacterium]
MENDFFGSAGTDRYFTNGLNVMVVAKEASAWLGELAKVSHQHEQYDSNSRRVSFTGGQDIYTPQDIEDPNLIEDDRPYAGWLYLGMGVHDRRPLPKAGGADRNFAWQEQDSTEVILGIIGPQSYTGDVQYWWHENVIGFSNTRKPSGWDNQLDNELAFALLREHKWRIRRLGADREGLEVDLVPHVGAAVGTVTTYASAGAEARLGWNLPDDFGSAKNRAGLSSARVAASHWGAGDEARRKATPVTFHLFGKMEGRAVLRDIFLDGNTFADSHSVDRKPLTFSVLSGVSVLFWHIVEVAYTHVYQSKEFEGQPLAHVYGTLTMSVYW